MHIATIGAKIDDRVADELTGSVICDVAAAPRLVDLDAALGKLPVACADVRAPAVAFHAKRQHMRVLHEQQDVVNLPRSTLLDQPALKCQRLAVRDQPEMADD
jgi:hypothetical protein